jgi:K+-sensing histidine kinase KdpD
VIGSGRSGRGRGEAAKDLLLAAGVVLGTVGVALALRERLGGASVAVVLVCAVVVTALRTGRSAAAFAAVLAALAWNFLFTEPRWTLRIHDAGDVVVFAVMAAAALLVGQLASRQRQQLVELERARERLEATRAEADTEKLRTALLSSVSHDLRTPLSAVIGAASTLSEYGESMPAADRRALVESIRGEGERLDRYIQNLLDMTRLGSGPLALHRDWVGLDEIVAATLARIARSAGRSAVEVDLEPALPPLHVHAALIEQALFNVLDNALRHSPEGTRVRLAARRDGARLVLDVDDRGPGIPAPDRERIFEPFTGGGRGSGLGLTIVRGMIRAHGGTVEALDAPGGGARLRLTLPLAEPPAPPAEEDEA